MSLFFQGFKLFLLFRIQLFVVLSFIGLLCVLSQTIFCILYAVHCSMVNQLAQAVH